MSKEALIFSGKKAQKEFLSIRKQVKSRVFAWMNSTNTNAIDPDECILQDNALIEIISPVKNRTREI